MKDMDRKIICAALLALAEVVVAEVPAFVTDLMSEMRERDASVRCGGSKEGGFFIVGIGTARYRDDDVALSREIAEANAKKKLASVLGQSLQAKSVAAKEMTTKGDKSEVSEFFSSLTETSVKQLLKGVQVASSGKNKDGQMEVVLYLTARMSDMTDALQKAMLSLGDKGVVSAVGIAAARDVAERNALRSAVEQVAGTMVVGKVSVNEKEEMHKRLATTAGALVEEYRVVKESKVEMEYRVEILARVDKRKLYDNYRSYFKCLENPAFCLVATDESLARHFNQFFIDKGFRIVDDPAIADYFVKLDGRFVDRPTPGNGQSMGTMLSLNISVVAVDGSRTLLSVNERQAKDSAVLSPEQRRDEVSRRIFEKVERRLHQAIQDMVVRMLDEEDSGPVPSERAGTKIQ